MLNYGVPKHYAGSMVSDRCPLGYLFAGVESLMIAFEYVGCKQSLGGVVPEISHDMQMLR